jgi:hypothetical protein
VFIDGSCNLGVLFIELLELRELVMIRYSATFSIHRLIMLLPLDASGCGGLDSVSGVECRAITPFRACSKVESQSTIHNFQLFISEVWLAALTEAARSKRETDQQLLSYLLLVRSCVRHPLVPHTPNRLKISLVSQQKGLLASFPRESPQEKTQCPSKKVT